MKQKLYIFFFIGISALATAQNDTLVSEKGEELEELVISAQIEPQSVRKSISTVRVISREDIENRAAVNLADILNQYLKIQVIPNRGQGRSSLSLFGLDGQYLKILVDNIPVVSDGGFGNNVDVTQINLNDIERIEIVEGSMGVTHGGNAVSGIVNIITKRSVKGNAQVEAFVIEETVGNEYGLPDKGKHIQNAKISKNFGENWFASLAVNHSFFSGYYNDRTGALLEGDGDEKKRGHEWLPKENLVTSGVVAYNKNGTHIFYKADYLTEQTAFYNPIIKSIPNYPFDATKFADDRNYVTKRLYHHLNANGKMWRDINYNVSLSFQKQTRDVIDYRTFLPQNRIENKKENIYESSKVWYSTGQFSNFFPSEKISLQLGYEWSNQTSYASPLSGIFRNENNQGVAIEKSLANYDFYSVLEYSLNNNWAIRPGARYSFQTVFENQYAYSLGTRYNPSEKMELRASAGQSFRTPNFEELYTYFVDSNHNLQGNKDLLPESSRYVEFSSKYFWIIDAYEPFYTQFSTSYLDVKDRISLALVDTKPTYQYKYINIDAYKVWNATIENNFVYGRGELKVDLSILGISQDKSTGAIRSSSDFLFTPQATVRLIYNDPLLKTKWAIYYKYQGKAKDYIEQTDENRNAYYAIATTEDASWLDISVARKFWKDRLNLTLGARNIFNIKTLQSSLNANNVAHGTGDRSIPMSYGTSFFLKLLYQFNL